MSRREDNIKRGIRIARDIAKGLNIKLVELKHSSFPFKHQPCWSRYTRAAWKNRPEGYDADFFCERSIVTLPAPFKIYLGLFKDEEERIFSFFHELGHVLMEFPLLGQTIEQEKEATEIGILIAKSHRLIFSKRVIKRWEARLPEYEKELNKKELCVNCGSEDLGYWINDVDGVLCNKCFRSR